ncbi:MAG: MerR family DNA-binding transcriptional regulator [Geminicoccaceae bacterium]
MTDRFCTIGELARELAMTPRAIRFYEDKGLISPRRFGSQRVYGRRERGRLVLILRGKRLGFSLREIREWLDLYDADTNQIAQSAHLRKKIDHRIAELEDQRVALDETLDELREVRSLVDSHLMTRNMPSLHAVAGED